MRTTTVTPRRSSRLKLREPSTKAASERNLKSKKVITTSKTSRKLNVSARGKSSRVSARNLSVRNSQVSSIRLRPRQNRKNYCEDSRLLKRYILPKKQDSMVMLEKINYEDKKVPVYEAMESSEKSLEGQNDVYDFKFDINDTREKAKKKQRKRNVNKEKGKTTKKTTRKKTITQPKMIGRKAIKSEPDANFSKKIAQNEPALGFAESTKQDIVKTIKMSEVDTDIQTEKSINNDGKKKIEPLRIDEDIQTVKELTKEDVVENMETPRADIDIPRVEETTFPDKTFAEQIREDDASKPRIISIENADDIIVTKSPPNNTEDSRPFRPKNIFDNKTSLKGHNSKIERSLLTKTLSPILKTANTLDLGSPWRPPTLMFSHTKHFIQSTPYRNIETKEIKKADKKSIEMNKEDVEMNKENTQMDKENMDMNKENTGRRDKERKKKTVALRKKHAISQKKLPILENRAPKKVRAAVASKSVVQPAPARISLGEIKNLLQNNGDNKQIVDETHAETDKSIVKETNKQLVDFHNFSDTFDVFSESERLSNIGNDAPLFMDLEPSHFSKPPQHSYRRKRTVKFDISGNSGGEEEKENVKPRIKKRKLTKSDKEHEKRINEWINTINTTFQEIEEHDLVIE